MKPNVNKPVENQKLSALLKELNRADDTRRDELRESVAEELAENAYLLAVIHMDDNDLQRNEDGTATFQKDAIISWEMFSQPDGTHYLPVYTDWNELRKGEKYKDAHVNTLIISFDDMVAFVEGKAGIVVNPFSDNFVLSREDVTHMKQHKECVTKGFDRRVVTKETEVLVGEPASYPTEMVEAIKKYAKKNKAIQAMWLKLMAANAQLSYLLIVDFRGEPNAVLGASRRLRDHTCKASR